MSEAGPGAGDPASFRARMDAVPLSVLGTIVDRLEALPAARRFPLHQGKSHFFAPFDFADCERDLGLGLQHDGPPQGMAALIDAVRASLDTRLGRAVDPSCLQVTNGITHGLSLSFGCLLAPGDEVLLLSPYWLFASGVVTACGGIPVEIPYFLGRRPADAGALEALLCAHLGPRTRAIYFNSPNNPSGAALARWEVAAICDFARRHGLYVIADNAYDEFDFSPDGFVDPAAADLAPDLAFSLYSFSKTFGYTGFRIGYMIAPAPFSHAMRALSLHSIYCVSTASQCVAVGAMRDYQAIVARHRDLVRAAMDLTVRELRVPIVPPHGGFYAFLDLRQFPGGGDRFIGEAAATGVSLVPGGVFGRDYGDYARLCFTAIPPERLSEALEILNRIHRAG